MDRIAIIGASGAIGRALVIEAAERYPNATVFAISRKPPAFETTNIIPLTLDYSNETDVAKAAENGPFDLIFIATGILHDGSDISPEKSLSDLSASSMQHVLAVNTITPMILAKHFVPQLARSPASRCAILSARVGSISDNRLGGWYSYRASKAALNMLIKTAAIELKRRNPKALIVGLHPGTVDSDLSKPFQARVPKDKLFTPDYSARCLLDVLIGLDVTHSGTCFAWDGAEIAP